MTHLPFTSLDAATATGPGAAKDLEGVFSTHTICVTTTGSPSSMNVVIERSHDGVNWFSTGSPNISAGPTMATVDTHLVRYVRANLTSLSGGSAPTVTATIASK